MWQLLTESPEAIRAIYGTKAPLLNQVYISELKIINGEDIQCLLKFDIGELPENMPQKWIDRKVNTVQIEILLVALDIIFFQNKKTFLSGQLKVELVGNCKRVSLVKNEELVFAFNTDRIYIQTIKGYHKKM
jgi:hypothetical protein